MAICVQGENLLDIFLQCLELGSLRFGVTRGFFFFCQALAVIDYLISNGSERAVDEIIEHTYQISVSIFLFRIDRSFSCVGRCGFLLTWSLFVICHPCSHSRVLSMLNRMEKMWEST